MTDQNVFIFNITPKEEIELPSVTPIEEAQWKIMMNPNKIKGMNPIQWVKVTILPYVTKNEEGIYVIPDPFKDFERHAGLHSWYKKYGDGTKVYPILRVGSERAYNWSEKEKNDAPDNQLTWAFLRPNVLFDEWNAYHYSKQPYEIMKDQYVFLTGGTYFPRALSYEEKKKNLMTNPYQLEKYQSDFSKLTEYAQTNAYRYAEISRAEEMTIKMLKTCQVVRDRIIRLLLIVDSNPPKTPLKLLYDDQYDDQYQSELIDKNGVKHQLIAYYQTKIDLKKYHENKEEDPSS